MPTLINSKTTPANRSFRIRDEDSLAGYGGGGGNAGDTHLILAVRPVPLSAPSGADTTRAIPPSYALRVADFGFTDGDGDAFASVRITTLPGAGTLYFDANGALGGGRAAVTAGQSIGMADIAAGHLTFVAAAGASGAGYASFTFQVKDGSGSEDPSPNSLTFDLLDVYDPPAPVPSTIELGAIGGNGFRIAGDASSDEAGKSVSDAGDVNGDGFADVIIGAFQNDSGGADAGAAYVIFGKASGFGPMDLGTPLTASQGFKIQGDLAGDFAGYSVSAAGDVNRDGFADVIVGAYHNDGGGSNAGAAYVIFGKASGFGLIDLGTPLGASDGLKIQGDAAGDFAGFSVSGAGDVNGDGFADVIVGANGNDSGAGGAGAAYVIFGKASGFGTIDLGTPLGASDGFKIQGDAASDYAGWSVSAAGDVNGDGFADVIVGAISNDSGGGNAGAAYVIFGKASGFGLVDLGTALDPDQGFKIEGEVANDVFGMSVSAAGDVNGDGFADVIVGAIQNDAGAFDAGAAYVIFGHASGFGTIDLGTPLTASVGFKILGDANTDQAGWSVSGAGDVNGDGFADIIVGAPRNFGAQGTAYVIFGHASGFGTIDLGAPLPLSQGFKIRGEQFNGDNAARSVSAAGDVNGDGFDDLIVGAPYNDGGGTNAGSAYVIFGRASSTDPAVARPDAVSTDEATILNGNVFNDNGSGADSDDDGGEPFSVTAVNGNAGAVGNQIALASGALLTVNADGTFTYNPNHAFDATPAAGSGASNTPVPDSFTYTVTGGSTATVSVTVNGIDTTDILLGTGHADSLNGGVGADRMTGWLGNDWYFVDNAGDVVIENVGEGDDRVFASASYALGTGADVETLTTIDYTKTTPINLTGSNTANFISGNDGANSLYGAGGIDVLAGRAGNDLLDGGTGADRMIGQTGDDWYFVEEAGDVVVENAGEGDDRVFASLSYALAANASVETLTTTANTGTAAIDLTGNGIANFLYGNDGVNSLYGAGGNDTLASRAGNDVLDGGAGADTMIGAAGNDFYYADNAGDVVVESAGEGSDRVFASASYALSAGADVETLTTTASNGTGAIDLTGNGLAQFISGNDGENVLLGLGGSDSLVGRAGNDILDGGTGADTLVGGSGLDVFRFTTALGGGNVDTIADFSTGFDRLALDDAAFSGMTVGALAPGAFRNGTAAADADDRIVYDQATGNLWFDADGTGATAAMLFAHLAPGTQLAASDIVVV